MRINKILPLTLVLFFFFSLLGEPLAEVYAGASLNQVQVQETSENTQEPSAEEKSKNEEREKEEHPVEADLISAIQKNRGVAENLSALPVLAFAIFFFAFFMMHFMDVLKNY